MTAAVGTTVKPGERGGMGRVNLIIAVMTVIPASLVILTFPTENRWIGHAAVGIAGFALAMTAVVTGFVLKRHGSLFRPASPYRVHRRISTAAGLFLAGAFALGLLVTMGHGEPVLLSPHGRAGLLVLLLAAVQVVPSLVVANRSLIRVPHRVVGYTLTVATGIQLLLGIRAAGLV